MDLHQPVDISPDATTSLGGLAITLRPAGDHLTLEASHRGRAVFARVELGITVDGVRLGPHSAVVDVSRRRVRETYRKYTGKVVGTLDVDHQETAYTLRDPDGRRWGLVVRVARDGFAFRYVVPEAGVLGAELTRYVPHGAGRAWPLEYQTWYETPRFGSDLDHLADGDYGFPLLLTATPESFVLISESDIDGRSSGAHVRYTGGAFALVTADDTAEVEAGHATPWRVAIVGDLAEIVASHLVDDLAPAAATGHLTLPRPGRAAWSWWSSQYSGAYLDDQKRFTDFAAAQGWEHLLVDCGWDPTWVPELVSYASARGVQVHLWSSWKDLDGPEALAKLALWRSWGVAGIKVDFMESESRERYRWYDAIIAETARVGLVVNFHGSVIPRGWARTHPHVVSYEGIRGAEYYVFYQEPLTAAHNVIQPFTRNVVGAMDYTPVAFSAPRRETSDAHELALAVVYESGITHFADDPGEYTKRPAAATFLAELAPAWEEVRLLDGHPDRGAVIARRSGDRWFVGAISATGPERVTLSVASLVDGPADVLLVTDDGTGGLAETILRQVTEPIPVDLAHNGGYAAIVAPAGAPLVRAAANPRYALPRIEPAVSVVGDDGTAVLDADPRATLRLAPGWTAVPGAHRGQWTVRAPAGVRPGDRVVVAAEIPGADGVPAVAHAQVVAPLSPGSHPLSTMPFLRCRNEVGPVERNAANGGGDPRDGGPLTVAGVVHEEGLGVSQRSAVEFALAGGPRLLTGAVGIDDETPDATVVARILVDGVERSTFALRGGEAPVAFEVTVEGAATLELRTEPGPDGVEAHVDWLRPQLVV
ncbi:glycoside hydrolase family 97 catalytic domain-containing protein [Plantactinospora sp. ZYX-F-223]|uniref:glycoside hydrolase family 97 catalytic domain-containing protein n=1 Tax=Plantactinospora sp. ZYX-F-223 TaxID=3144103 RepID=UPI0031FDBEFE